MHPGLFLSILISLVTLGCSQPRIMAEHERHQEVRPPIIVAVIDTGYDASNRSLDQYLLNMPFYDKTIHGWDFVENQAESDDVSGHGTMVAQIIAKSYYSGSWIKLMIIRYTRGIKGQNEIVGKSIQAFRYAIEHGAQIINFSAEGPEKNTEEWAAISDANNHGVLVVTAAGNEGKNVDVEANKVYPANYQLPNIISVGSIQEDGQLSSYSNWGNSVDVAAPGGAFGNYKNVELYGQGTSFSTAYVTKVAAALLYVHPGLSPFLIKTIIEASVDSHPGLKGKIKSGGSVNIKKALAMARFKTVVTR